MAQPAPADVFDEIDDLMRSFFRAVRVATPRARQAGLGLLVLALLGVTVAAGWFGVQKALQAPEGTFADPPSKAAVDTIVGKIIIAESNGDPNAKNKRSSATGAAQFLDETWLRMVRIYRPDLVARGEKEVLDLRRDPELAREITMRFAERNAALLARRGLDVTPGRLYLSHFAGGTGAVAILSAPDDADAATVMAAADSTGRMTRDKIVKANPFLASFTVTDIKRWADRKMCGRTAGTGGAAPTGSLACP